MTFKVIHIIICPINKLTDVIINGETYIKLSNAAAYVDSGVVAKLLESLQGLDKETLKSVLMARDSNRYMPLHWAAYRGHIATLKAILNSVSPEDAKELLELKNNAGRTVLAEASSPEKKT